MTGVVRVGLEDTVGRRVVSGSIHGIGAGLVERRRESHIASDEVGDCDFRHDGGRSHMTLNKDGRTSIAISRLQASALQNGRLNDERAI